MAIVNTRLLVESLVPIIRAKQHTLETLLSKLSARGKTQKFHQKKEILYPMTRRKLPLTRAILAIIIRRKKRLIVNLLIRLLLLSRCWHAVLFGRPKRNVLLQRRIIMNVLVFLDFTKLAFPTSSPTVTSITGTVIPVE